jgi:chorismate mutase/prephenate dehydrogenase
MSGGLGTVRRKISEIDAKIVELMIERDNMAKTIGELKKELNFPLRNRDVEEDIVRKYRNAVNGTLVPADVAEAVARILISSSVEIQSVILRRRCEKKVAIVGGRGKMGKWLTRYFKSMGAEVLVIGASGDINDIHDSDIVVISVPISAVPQVLADADRICRDDALIFDISSIKSPFAATLREMAARRNVCSVHPMFGPSVKTMTDRSVVICDCGCERAVAEAKRLFSNDDADIVTIPVERHDVLISYVLALAHASNIAFFAALSGSGISFDELKSVTSTTFDRTLSVSIPVSKEKASMYHEIQRLNVNAEDMWKVYEKAFKEVMEASLSEDPKRFAKIMEEGKKYFEGN